MTDQYIIHAKLISDISYIINVVSVESVDTILTIFLPRCNLKNQKKELESSYGVLFWLKSISAL